ncbi:MAG: LutB/LldF family L-lactate oxidation iron-sulfur protein [Bacteroidales bacterium]|jgi:L-lactate dehydrogenase complex protein LldF
MVENTTADKFQIASEKKAFDREHRKTIKFNISRYDIAVEKGKKQYCNLELAKQKAANIKNKTIDNLEKNLIDFEANFTRRGGKVIWAVDTEDAIRQILEILEKANAKKIVKSKSMVTEEIDFNEHFEKKGFEVLETDLGEFIVQLCGEKPYHIITPVMHRNKKEIAEIFNKKYNLPIESTPEEITKFVRNLLREKFVNADVGITGGNFLIVDIGAVALTENEGNGVMSVSFPKIHIAITGIEKLIPSINDLDLFWPLLSTHGTGQYITAYNSIITGPRQEGESDGPEEMYVVLIDNNRSELLKKPEQRRALSCIRCGACLNGCPVYKNIGGHTYSTTYSGPIGSVISPFLRGFENYKHLSYASTLCGKCTEVCPVKINLHKLLLYNRRDSVESGYAKKSEKFTMFVYKKAMLNRWLIEKGGYKIKNYAIRKFFSKAWGSRRDVPQLMPKSFNRLWKEKQGIK